MCDEYAPGLDEIFVEAVSHRTQCDTPSIVSGFLYERGLSGQQPSRLTQRA